MQPGYPNPHMPPQNPMQPMPPAPGSFPAPASRPVPPPQAPYSPPPQPVSGPSHPPAQPNFTQSPQPRPMNDIAPPTPSYSQPPYPQNPMQPTAPAPSPFPVAGQQPYTQPAAQPLRPQLVQDIPVRVAASTPADQFSPHPYSPPQQRPENPFNVARTTGDPFTDNHMEDILKDVNRNVSRSDPKVRKNPVAAIASKLKLTKLKTHTKKVVSHPKPIMIVGLAAVAFISLALAAFFAFNSDSTARPLGPEVKVVGTTAAAGDSIQAGGGTLVSPQEVEDLTDSLKKQVNGFNESQDFGQDPLTDQSLGL